MINFIKRGLIQQKSQNAWVYVWNHENKSKRKGIKVLPALWEKNLAKIWLKTTKKSSIEPCQVGEREESLKKIWKSVLNQPKHCFKKKKIDSQCSIDRKTGSINRTRQRLTEIFKKDSDWSKIRLDQSKFWKNSFLEK